MKEIILWIVLVFLAPFAVCGQTLSLSGTVVDARSEPVPGIKVYIYQEGLGMIGPALTDDKGVFAFYDVRGTGSFLIIFARSKGPGSETPDQELLRGEATVPSELGRIGLPPEP